MRGNTAAVELLVAAGFPAKARSSRGWTAFDEACAAQAMPAARCVLRLGGLLVVLLAAAAACMHAEQQQANGNRYRSG